MIDWLLNAKLLLMWLLQEGLGGLTLLHLAIKQSDEELFTYLLGQWSVDVNKPTYGRRTALDIACQFTGRQTMIQRLRTKNAQHSPYCYDESASSSTSSDDSSP